MGKQARLKALRSTMRAFAKANDKEIKEVSQQAFYRSGMSRREDDTTQAAWYFLKGNNK